MLIRSIVLSLATTVLLISSTNVAQAGWLQRATGGRLRTPDIIRRADPTRPIYREGNQSCLSVMTEENYSFRISNRTANPVNYSINNQSFTLSSGYYREHKYPKAIGTNSCNVTNYPLPLIEFDADYANGLQLRKYRIGDSNNYYFHVTGQQVVLRK